MLAKALHADDMLEYLLTLSNQVDTTVMPLSQMDFPAYMLINSPDADFLNQINGLTSESKEKVIESKERAFVINAQNCNFYLEEYVHDIFIYYLSREWKFKSLDYMKFQVNINKSDREMLINWLVTIHLGFALDQECLYRAVKIVDLYLSKNCVEKNRFHLLGAISMFIASKFETRRHQRLEVFMDICNDEYSGFDFLEIEREVLQCIDFDLGMPLSYSFLIGYAQRANVSKGTLYLACYILEASLTDYKYTLHLGSLLACAALFLAIVINKEEVWPTRLIHYTYYTSDAIMSLVYSLLKTVTMCPRYPNYNRIYTKYLHEDFLGVALICIPEL